MRDHNTVILSGRLSDDPRPFTTPGGDGCEITLVSTDQRLNKRTGNPEEHASFLGIVCYDGVNDRARLLRQGDHILITGTLRSEELPRPGSNGAIIRKTKIRAATIETLRAIHPPKKPSPFLYSAGDA